MPDVTELHGIELVPVLELEPSAFSTQERPIPSGAAGERPRDWEAYWRACLADSGIKELRSIAPGSWYVSTSEFTTPQLENFLRLVIDEQGGISSLKDAQSTTALSGGFALNAGELSAVIEPTCCGDLADIANWKDAASFQGEEWQMLWIGHPWLSMKFQKPCLLLSEPHESDKPVGKWAVNQDELGEAVKAAETELIRFSKQVEAVMLAWDFAGDSAKVSSKLAGLNAE